MKTAWYTILLLSMGLFILPAGCSENGRQLSDKSIPLVRVRLLQDQAQVDIRASHPPVVRTGENTAAHPVRISEQPVSVRLTAQGWRIGDTALGGGVLTFQPNTDGSMAINGQPYHGIYRFVPVSADRFDVVNEVNVEDYLKGVISREMPSNWDIQAYKAQAIVARTYALYEVKTGPSGRYWDLYPDERSQVYGGIAAETSKAVAAVDATRGIVVAYGARGHERIFKAYFSACCGGISQSAADAFGDAWSEPLSAQNRGGVCAASPVFNWAPVSIKTQELARRLRLWGQRRNRPEQAISSVASVEIRRKNQFGRPSEFLVTDDKGTSYSLRAEELRTAINTDAPKPETVRSSFFRPVARGDAIQFVDGHGFGHGVGLCQWCAQVRAEHGQRPEDIVLSFYPRSVIVRAY